MLFQFRFGENVKIMEIIQAFTIDCERMVHTGREVRNTRSASYPSVHSSLITLDWLSTPCPRSDYSFLSDGKSFSFKGGLFMNFFNFISVLVKTRKKLVD